MADTAGNMSRPAWEVFLKSRHSSNPHRITTGQLPKSHYDFVRQSGR